MAVHERVWGRLGKDPDEIFDKNGNRCTKFSLCVDGMEEGPVWYTVFAGSKIADFVIRHLTKGAGCQVAGTTSTSTWTDRAGKPRLDRRIRAQEVTLHGGESCEAEAEDRTNSKSDETLEMELRARHMADLVTYPPRWQKPGWQETVGGRWAMERDPALFEPDALGALLSPDAFEPMGAPEIRALVHSVEVKMQGA